MVEHPPTRWCVGICAVIFDIDVGQRIDHLTPETELTEEEMASVAFHSFPDSMSMELHAKTSVRDTCFWFRVRRSNLTSTKQQNGTAGNPIETFLYGFVFCRQRQDETLRRGGEQISVVVLSEHPFSSVLRPLSQVAGPLYFSHGAAALNQVYQEVCSWPAPTAGGLLQLQVGLNTLPGRLPPFETLPHPSCLTAVDVGPPLNRSSVSSMGRPSITGPGPAPQGSGNLAELLPSGLPDQGAATISDLHRVGSTGSTSLLGVPLPPVSTASTSHLDLTEGAAGTPPISGVFADLESMPSSSPLRTAGSSQQLDAGGSGRLSIGVDRLSLQGERQGSGVQLGQSGSGPLGLGGLQQSGHNYIGSRQSLASLPTEPAPDSRQPVNLSRVQSSSRGSMALPPMPSQGAGGGQSGTPTTQVPRRLSAGLSDASVMAAGAFSDADIFTPLQPHLQRLWQLWEMVLIAKPLLVVGPSPADCSGAVAALISLVAPLPYAPDFRPYYTIHDAAFASLARGALPGPHQRSVPCMMGITNLYFVKALTHWPNILSVGRKEVSSSWAAADSSSSSTGVVNSMFSAAGAVKALRLRAQGSQSLMGGHIEALWSTYKPLTRPDNTLIVRLLQPKQGDAKSKLARIAAVNNEALRRHFHELTTAFLAPFERYFTLGPGGYLPRWNESEFLFTIRSPPAPLPPVLMQRVGGVVGNLVELYGRFVSSTNFRDWFLLNRRALQHLEQLPDALQAPSPSAGGTPPNQLSWFSQASQHMGEVQLMNLFFELTNQLQQIEEDDRDAPEQEAEAEGPADEAGQVEGTQAEGETEQDETVDHKKRIQRELVNLFLGIGKDDLQMLCVSSPVRRQMLLDAAAAVATEDARQQVISICDKLQ